MSLIKKYNKYIFLFILSILLSWILIGFNNFVIAKPIPGLLGCKWHYINDVMYTDCGHKMTDGCPYCGKKLFYMEI